MGKVILTLILFFFIQINSLAFSGYTDNSLPSKIEKIGDDSAGNRNLGIKAIFDEGDAVDQCGLAKFVDDIDFANLIEDLRGKFTRIDSLNITGERVLWVDEFEYSSYDASPTIRMCAAQCFALVSENCATVSVKSQTTVLFPRDNKKLIASLKTFSLINPGDTSGGDGDTTRGHRVGYAFNLYSGECPYYNTGDQNVCISQMRLKGEIVKNYYLDTPYSEANNCYEAARELFLNCTQDPNECKCSKVSGDDEMKQNCDAGTKFIPNANGAYWNGLSMKQKGCFVCYQQGRTALNKCLRASFDKGVGYGPKDNYSNKVASLISSMKNSVSDSKFEKLKTFQKMYGPGIYVCGYEGSESDSNRIGCMKMKSIQGPRPFPRIAFNVPQSSQEISAYNADPLKANKGAFFVYSAAHIFGKPLFVSQFKNDQIPGECYGEADLGEETRGDFYNPAIYIQYGTNRVRFWFHDNNPGGAMAAKYNDGSAPPYQSTKSDWSTRDGDAKPVTIKYGLPSTDGTATCTPVFDNEEAPARICLRIEYNEDMNKEFFVAYAISSKIKNGDCDSIEIGTDSMELLGATPRPPLKYVYDPISKQTVTPIKMGSPIATDSSAQTFIYLDPLVNKYFIRPDSNSKGKIKQNFSSSQAKGISANYLTLEFFNMKLTIPADKGESADLASVITISENANRCGLILNHKICIGPFMGTDCKILTSDSEDIRGDIKMKILTNKTQCPSNDGSCSLELDFFNNLYPQCVQYKRCARGADASDCSNEGNLKIKIDSSIGRWFNYGWTDGVCVTQGIELADFSQFGNTRLYGNFGNGSDGYNVTEGNENVVSFSGTAFPISMKTNGSYETGPEKIVTAGDKYFTTSSDNTRIQYLKDAIDDASNVDLIDRYIGACDDSCIKSNITVRPKNIDEIGLCAKFDRVNKIEFGGLDGSSSNKYRAGHRYNYYIPKRCDYLEAYVFGAGGKSEQWNSDARLEFKASSITECWGRAYYVAFCYMVGWLPDAPCDGDEEQAKLVRVCTRMLESQAGGGGGYTHAMLDLSAIDSDHLGIVPGKDMSLDLPFYTTWSNRNDFTDYDNIDNWSGSDDRDKYQHSRIFKPVPPSSKQDILFAGRGRQGMPYGKWADGGDAKYTDYFIVQNGYGYKTCPTPPDNVSAPGSPTRKVSMDPLTRAIYPQFADAMDRNSDGNNACYVENEMTTACLYSTAQTNCIVNGQCDSERINFYNQSNPNINSINATTYPNFAAAMNKNRSGKNPKCYIKSDKTSYCKYNLASQSCVLDNTCEEQRKAWGDTDVFDAREKRYKGEGEDGYCYNWSVAEGNGAENSWDIICQLPKKNGNGTLYRSYQAPDDCDTNAFNETFRKHNKQQEQYNCHMVDHTVNGVTTQVQECDTRDTWNWCCAGSTCKNQKQTKEDTASNSNGGDSDLEETQFEQENSNYRDKVKQIKDKWIEMLITSMINLCPAVIKGEAGGSGWPELNGGVIRKDGGGNIASLALTALDSPFKCKNDQCLKDNLKNLEYKMTEEYCYRGNGCDDSNDPIRLPNGTIMPTDDQQEKQQCSKRKSVYDLYSDDTDPDYKNHRKPNSSLGYGGNYGSYANSDSGKKVNIAYNPFISSGGCMIDTSTDTPNGETEQEEDWDDSGDTKGNRESWGGNGFIRLGVPYVQYNALGTMPILGTNGRKVLNKAKGMRDYACVPKCPRAFVEMGDYVCEYSNGDPGRLFESPMETVVNPIKCFDSDGRVHIPPSGVDRTCLFTKCQGLQFFKRYSDLCEDVDIYFGRHFAWGGGFFIDTATKDEYNKYCGSKNLTAGVDYEVTASLDSFEFSLTCDDHGNWRDRNAQPVTYACPKVSNQYMSFLSQNLTNAPVKAQYGVVVGGKACSPFGIWMIPPI